MKTLRTFLMFLCVALLFLGQATATLALQFTPPFEVASQGVYLVDFNTGKVLYEKNAEQQQVPASIVKIMTAILAIEKTSDMQAKITATYDSFNAIYGKNASNAGMVPGEEMNMVELLYGLLLKSGCDAAEVIAREIANGDTDLFVQMMNQKAQEIGAKNTVFADASGLDNDASRSTPYDIYLMTKYALSLPLFEEIATAQKYELAPTNKRGESDQTRFWTHSNLVIHPTSKYYNAKVRGIKTGTTGVGTKNLVTMAQKDGNSYLLVLMGAPYEKEKPVEHTYLDTNHIYDWVFDTFTVRSIVTMDRAYVDAEVQLAADKNHILGVPEKNITALLPKEGADFSLETDITQNVVQKSDLVAPLAKGDVVGEMELLYQGEIIGRVNLVAAEEVRRSSVKFVVARAGAFFSNVWVKTLGGLFVVLLLSYLGLMVRYNAVKRKRRELQKRRRDI